MRAAATRARNERGRPLPDTHLQRRGRSGGVDLVVRLRRSELRLGRQRGGYILVVKRGNPCVTHHTRLYLGRQRRHDRVGAAATANRGRGDVLERVADPMVPSRRGA